MRRIKRIFFLLLAGSSIVNAQVSTNTITQYGITWTFDANYTTGQFANGDYWVVGPVTLIGISPQSTEGTDYGSGPRIINGSMINPTPADNTTQGYDSEAYAWSSTERVYAGNLDYDDSKNIARINGQPISSTNTRVIPVSSSIVSTISTEAPGRPIIQTAAVLTVLDEAPPADAFRPAYAGSDKTIQFTKSQLNYSALANLAAVEGTPSLEKVEDMFNELWLDHVPNWSARYLHPVNSMSDYGQYLSRNIGDAILRLNISATDAEKEKLLIYIVQLGIDNYRVMQLGAELASGNWPPNGGHNMGRKLPIVLAGKVLGNNDMLNIGVWNPSIAVGNFNPVFQEDLNLFYVAQSDVDETKIGRSGDPIVEQYTQDMIGMPEWGIEHSGPIGETNRDNSYWNAGYRHINATAVLGHVLSAYILGLKTNWQNDLFFEYYDRWWNKNLADGYLNSASDLPEQALTPFTYEMWKTYRDNYGIETSINDKNTIHSTNCAIYNYPNPFEDYTFIEYTLSKTNPVSLKIYDVVGNEIAVLINEIQQPGKYKITFNPETYHCKSGMYIYKLDNGNQTIAGNMVLLK
ncbi:MAG: T9SS type A sorting domain-containing protein [Bacteroidales bacterium]|nr:T9SS type A sorting domain-containing protein [Bacteroidales bacterium]